MNNIIYRNLNSRFDNVYIYIYFFERIEESKEEVSVLVVHSINNGGVVASPGVLTQKSTVKNNKV